MNESASIKRVRIANIIYETPNAKTFVLDFLDGWDPVYEPGQFITLVFYTKHGEKRRSYSISSAPVMGEPFSFTVKKVDNGEFSRLLISHARIGDIIFSSGISGLFLYLEARMNGNSIFSLPPEVGSLPVFR